MATQTTSAESTAGAGPDAVLWQRIPPFARDRVSTLEAREIAGAAFTLAQAEGIREVSVKRVAGRLGIPAVRLEQYLHSRDELFDLMVDEALAEVPVMPDDAGWRERATQLAEATYAVACNHPWLVELLGRPPVGPSGMRYVEQAMAVFDQTGADVRSVGLHVNALLALVCGSVRLRDDAGSVASENVEQIAAVLSENRHPRLAMLLADPAGLTGEQSFRHGLACLLDGIAQRVGGERRGTSP